jgi:FkbM family methyltransferase
VVSEAMKILSNGIAVIPGDTHISKWVEQEGRLDHDQNMLPLILKHINFGDWVLDIGAFIGDHTVAYAEAVGDVGRVLAFEPNPQAYECLNHNMKGYANVVTYNFPLSTYEGFEYENIISPNAGAGFVVASDKSGQKTRALDHLLLEKVNFIKIDAEGFEVEILEGAEKTINKFLPILLLEVNPGALERRGKSVKDLFYLLDRYGYKYRNIYEEQAMSGHQYDILCEKKD